MKNKTPHPVPYSIPEGFYIPVDKATKKKRNRTPILIAVAVCLVGLLFWGIFIGTTFHFLKSAVYKFYQNEVSFVFRQAEPYTHGDFMLNEKNQTVDAGPFRLRLPKNDMEMSEDEDSFYYDYSDERGTMHIESDKMLLVYDEVDWREYLWENTLFLSEDRIDSIIANYQKLFGFNPLENLYNFDRALYTVDYEKLNTQSFKEELTVLFFLLQKNECCDSYDTVYTLNTDTYCGFVQVFFTENGIELFLEAYAHDVPEEQYNIYIVCTGDYTENAYAILNSAQLRPDAREIAHSYYDAYQRSQEKKEDESHQISAA